MIISSVLIPFLIGQIPLTASATEIMAPIPLIREATTPIVHILPTEPPPPTIRLQQTSTAPLAERILPPEAPRDTEAARSASPGEIFFPRRIESTPPISSPARLDRIRGLMNAVRAFDAGQYREAEAAAERILKSDPRDTLALTIAGAARLRLSDPTGAIARFEAYIKHHPLEAMGHFYLGLARHLAADRPGAIESYWTALLLDSSLEAARANMNLLMAP